MDFTYDDSYLVSASVDCTIRLWNLALGVCMAEYKGHVRTIWSVEFDPKGFHFASGGGDRNIFVWSTNKQYPVQYLCGHTNDVTQVSFTQNLAYLCSTALDKTFRVWNLDDGSLVRILFFDEVLSCFEVSSNGDFLVGGSEEGSVYIWDLVKPLRIHSFRLMDEKLPQGEGEDLFGSGAKGKGGKFDKKIRSVKFSVDEKIVVINNKNKLAYYTTQSFKEERSKNIYEKYGSDEDCNKMTDYIEPVNFVYSSGLNILCNQPSVKNVVYCACLSTDSENIY